MQQVLVCAGAIYAIVMACIILKHTVKPSQKSRASKKHKGRNTNHHDSHDQEVLTGYTDAGEQFAVPHTRDTLSMLLQLTEVPTLVCHMFMIATILVSMPAKFMG